MADLYKGIEGSPITYLAADISANQTTISIADDSALPDGPNICTIGFGENLETIKYESKSNGVLQGVTRGIEGTPQAWQAGTEVARFFTAYDHLAIIDGIAENADNLTTHLAESAYWKRVDTLGKPYVSVVDYDADNPIAVSLSENLVPSSANTIKIYAVEGATFVNFRNGQILFFSTTTNTPLDGSLIFNALAGDARRILFMKSNPNDDKSILLYGEGATLNIRGIYKIKEFTRS